MKKFNLVLLIALIYSSIMAQRLPDSAIMNRSKEELGFHFMEKSRKQKNVGYVLLGVSMASAIASVYVLEIEFLNALGGSSTSGSGFYALSTISLGSAGAGIALLTIGSKNKGKAEMLLRRPGMHEPPGYELDLGFKFKRRARIKNSIALGLLVSGTTMTLLSNNTENNSTQNTLGKVGSIAIIASIPLFINAAGDKGRASILLKNENIPFSYYTKPIGLKSITLAIPLGN
jgi:hypothetical protein